MADCGPCWMLCWLLILIFLAWPIGMIAAGFYIFLTPFAVTSNCIDPVIDLLEKGLKLPLTCAQNLKNGKPVC